MAKALFMAKDINMIIKGTIETEEVGKRDYEKVDPDRAGIIRSTYSMK